MLPTPKYSLSLSLLCAAAPKNHFLDFASLGHRAPTKIQEKFCPLLTNDQWGTKFLLKNTGCKPRVCTRQNCKNVKTEEPWGSNSETKRQEIRVAGDARTPILLLALPYDT